MSKKKKTVQELLEDALISEKEQSYKVPENWIVVRMNSVVDVRDGTHDSPTYQETGIPLITSKNLKNGILDFNNVKFISKEAHLEICKRSNVERNDILFAMIGTIGNPVLIKQISQEFSIKNVALYKPNIQYISPKYLYYYLQSPKYMNYLKQNEKGSTQKFVPLNILRNAPLYFPPFNEQMRIAEKIEQLLNKVEVAKQLIVEAKETFEFRKSAILDKAFRGDLLNDATFEQTWVALEQVVEFENGDRSSTYPSTKEIVSEGIPFISTKELNGKLIEPDGESKFITIEKFNSLRSGKLQNNDIIMSIRGSVGKVGIFKTSNKYQTGFINAQLVILRCKEMLNPEFLLLYTKSHVFKNALEKKITGSAQPQLSVKELRNVLCSLPSLEIQDRIVHQINSIMLKMEKEQSIINLAILKLESIKQSILSKVFQGELGTNEPNEESAIELLKEILLDQIN
ncbi:restriction endonuclease subunit S [Gottfriedia acidiceleris]|uniref:restriction endonuclease subunit S n=1 Tax=Gottfriedia acidiceleris TaxID=371036 RepID=UPI002FFDB070